MNLLNKLHYVLIWFAIFLVVLLIIHKDNQSLKRDTKALEFINVLQKAETMNQEVLILLVKGQDKK